ncbi:MAG: amino acid adenylation domain-containing protein [Balneolaceae bacterium]
MIYDWARRNAEKNPDRTAVTLNDEHLSFGRLETKSNRLAGRLLKEGLKPGDRVGLLLEKTPKAIIAMHGVSKAGGIYVPLDIHSPASRVSKIINSSDVSMMLIDDHAKNLFDEMSKGRQQLSVKPWIWWAENQPEANIASTCLFRYQDLLAEPDIPYAVIRDENQTAHILFTSGSTGNPKGVEITHKNISSFIKWAIGYFGMNSEDRISGHSPLHFDLSTFDIYGAMAAGSHLFMVPPDISVIPRKLCDFITKNRLTQWFSVPSALSYLARFKAIPEEGFPELKRLIWCGEVFPVESLRYWMQSLPGVQFTNLYGPTEATIASSCYTVPEIPGKGEDIPIGIPCDGENLFVLDEEMKEVEPGKKGDLYISGTGLSPGYWRDSPKTDAVFRSRTNSAGDTIRIYKTGDLASFDKNGLFYCHGRSDYQIKSRGYRIELGEIESALDELKILREFAVVPVKKSDFEGYSIGCAYVPGEKILSPIHIKKHLSDKVPSYMIPQLWSSYTLLPRNGNGKIDRKKLSERFENLFLNHTELSSIERQNETANTF